MIAILLLLALVYGNLLRPVVARAIAPRTGRHAVIAGDLKLHLLSWTPSAEINGLSLTNPEWVDVAFIVRGRDLADVYYLTGLALPNTPSYRLAASVHVSGMTFRADDLNGQVGSSDPQGNILVETSGPRPKLKGKLTSRSLNLIDLAPSLGQPADAADTLSGPKVPTNRNFAKRSPNGAQPRQSVSKASDLVFPDADLQVDRVRGMDADVTYEAASVRAPKLHTTKVDFHLILNNGVLSLDPLHFVLDQGNFTGSVHIDASAEVPESTIDMHIVDVDLGQFKTAKITEAPLSGGLSAKNLFVDTTDVLVTGRGNIHLGDERLDLQVQGNPKKIRLTRVRAPITVKGTLAHPAIGVDAGKLAKQGAAVAALGTLLTPLAAITAFIDPGLAKDKDCAASLSNVSEPIPVAH